MSLDTGLTQTQEDGTIIRVDIKKLLAQKVSKRVEPRHCSHYDPQNGIMNLRINNEEAGLYGCLATHKGEKNGCKGLIDSMTTFGEYVLYICEHKQPD